MTLFHAIVLALVQGVTEFLPISSSAHLILMPRLFDWPDQGLAFDEAVHVGTLVAVIAYFRHDVARLLRDFFAGGWKGDGAGDGRLGWALALGTLPVALAALVVADRVATSWRDPPLIAVPSILFGVLLGVADRLGRRRRDLDGLRLSDAALIGLAQAVALWPGTSRSGITITAALALGFSRPAAARFSFLLAIPVGLLVAGHDLWQLAGGGGLGADAAAHPGWPAIAVGFLVAAVSAYLVIAWLLAWVRRQSLMGFAVYRVLLGIGILVMAAFG